MPLVELSGFFGANLKDEEHLLAGKPGYCVSSINQKPSESGDLRPWRQPLAIVGPVVPANRQTIYRMGRDSPSDIDFWLSFTGVVQLMRGFDTTDPTERTYFTGAGAPKWTDNIMALAGAPYPAGTRELRVPQPVLGATLTLNVDGPSGTASIKNYVYTWVSDIGWESAPSPPTAGPLAKPGAVIDLQALDTVPSGNFGVNRIRWYRTQENGESTEYFFLAEFAVAAPGQQDGGQDVDTTDGPLQPNGLWLSLPDNASWLIDCWNDFAAALVGKTVRYCEPNIIYAYPIEYEYAVTHTPLAQCAFAQRHVVFTTAGANVFTGQDPAAMDREVMQLAALAAVRSLVVGEKFCMWAAYDGLWYYGLDGYRCLTAKSMTEARWRALNPVSMHGYLLQQGERTLYVGFYNDGTLKGFVVDPLNPDGIYFLDKGYSAGYWDPLQRKLYVLDDATLKLWDAGGAFMTTTVRSAKVRQLSVTEGEWVEALGDGNVRVLVDGVQVLDQVVSSDQHRLPDGTVGRDWQLECATSTALQGALAE